MSEIDDRNIEINKDGIKLSYLRFLSDGGPGFTTIIYSLYLYSIDSLFVKENVLMHFNDIEFAFLFILLLFLSIPLGLAINASSWVLLGWFNISIEYLFIWIIEIYNMDICELYTSSKTKKLFFWIIKKSFWILSLFFKSTMEKYAFSEIKKFYKITKKNWYCKSCLIKETISTYSIDKPLDFNRK